MHVDVYAFKHDYMFFNSPSLITEKKIVFKNLITIHCLFPARKPCETEGEGKKGKRMEMISKKKNAHGRVGNCKRKSKYNGF